MTRQKLLVRVRDALLNNLQNGDTSAATHLLTILETYPKDGPEVEQQLTIRLDSVSDAEAAKLITAWKAQIDRKGAIVEEGR